MREHFEFFNKVTFFDLFKSSTSASTMDSIPFLKEKIAVEACIFFINFIAFSEISESGGSLKTERFERSVALIMDPDSNSVCQMDGKQERILRFLESPANIPRTRAEPKLSAICRLKRRDKKS